MEGRILTLLNELLASEKPLLLLVDNRGFNKMSTEFFKGAFRLASQPFEKTLFAVQADSSIKKIVDFFTNSTRYRGKAKFFGTIEEAENWLLAKD